ncbi:MAG TPA: hypothetical protein VHV08_02005, partial [Pirellulales bacterium]|nr:hypothetical protein [Pirellulales bacterium]
MAVTVPTKIDFATGMVLNMAGVRASANDPIFDSYLLKHNDGSNNHTLTLVLKIHLDPILPASMNAPPGFRILYPEWGGTFRVVKPWQPAEWNNFVTLYKQEALLWNDRFWLIPPSTFSALDVKMGGRTVRPNIYCHLYIDLVGSAANAHRNIVVVNLDAVANPFFRSDDAHYMSDAVVPLNLGTDNVGNPQITAA